MGKEKIKVYTYTRVSTSMHVETVALLSKLSQAKHHIRVKVDMDELDLTSAEAKATYKEIEECMEYIEKHLRHFCKVYMKK